MVGFNRWGLYEEDLAREDGYATYVFGDYKIEDDGYYSMERYPDPKQGNFISDPVSVTTGEFYENDTDLRVEGPLPIVFSRNYTSRNTSRSELGYNWLSGYPAYLIPSGDLAYIQAADTGGAVILFRRVGILDIWRPLTADNPEIGSVGGGSNNMLNSQIVRLASDIYEWRLPDGSVREYIVKSFPTTLSGTVYNRTRPYLNKLKDSQGNVLTFLFGTNAADGNYGRISNIKSSSGGSINFIHNTKGLITNATANDGREVVYTYSATDDLITVTLPDGKNTAYLYSTDGNRYITRVTKPNGRVLENTYDSSGRVTLQKATVNPARPGILIVNATFDYSVGGRTKVKDAYNRETIYEHAGGLITAIREPENTVTLKEWYASTDTPAGAYQRSLKKVTDPRGLITEYKYDVQGNIIETKLTGDLDGDSAATETTTTSATFNTSNLPTSITDPRGIITEFAYTDATYPYLPTQLTTKKGVDTLRIDKLAYTQRSGTDVNGQPILAKGLLLTKTVAFGTADETVTTYDYDATGFRTSETRATGTTDPAVVLTYSPTARREVASITDALGRSTTFTYDGLSRVRTTTVKNELSATLAATETIYTSNGEVAKTDGPRTDPEDWIEHDYDQAGRPSEDRVYRTQAKPDGSGVEAPLAATLKAVTTYRHDLFGNLTLVIDPRGHASTHQYDGLGRLTYTRRFSSTHASALLAQNTADLAAYRSYDGSLPSGVTTLSVESFTYEPGGEIATRTNVLGGVTTTLYTARGQPRKRTQADGSVSEWRYLPDGRLFKEILRNGTYWQTTYNDVARTVTRTLRKPDATVLATETRTYDRRGNLVSTTDVEGHVRTTTYDDLDRVKTTTGPVATATSARQTTTTVYDAAGKTLRVVNALGEAAVTTTDALGRPVLVEIKSAADAVIRQTAYAYSADHQSVTVTTGTGAAAFTRTTYTDPADRPLLEIDGLGKTTRHAYDLGGNRLATTDTLDRTTTWTYNALNQPLTQTLPDGNLTTFTHDAAGNLTLRAMAAGLSSETVYDNAGRVTSSRLYNGTTVSRSFAYGYYDAASVWAGLLQATTAPRATVTTTYDDFLRPLTVSSSGLSALDTQLSSTTTYAYDKRGLLTSATQTSPTAGTPTTVARVYDAYGQLTTETLSLNAANHSTVVQKWDAAGRRLSLDETHATRADPLFQYAYRADGLLSQITTLNAQLPTLTFTYADNGLPTSRAHALRTLTINNRDAVGRITRQSHDVAGVQALREDLAYRADGGIASYQTTHASPTLPYAWDETRAYAYNSRGQVTGEDFSMGAQQNLTIGYEFDQGLPGVGVRTRAKTGLGKPLGWEVVSAADTLARVTQDEQSPAGGHFVAAAGVAFGADHVNLYVDGVAAGPAMHPGWSDPMGAWSANFDLRPGSHTLVAEAVFPDGQQTATATSTFTVSGTVVASAVVTWGSAYDADGNATSRTGSNGTTQTLTWDAFNRLIKVTQRDTANNGYDWTAVYDAFGRRLKTTQQPVVANVASGAATVIASTFDPLVEFLEIGVAVNGVKSWKVYGPDLNGIYGGLNGTGGLEATILDADGTVKGVLTDAFGHGVATVTGTTVAWSSTRVGGYGPLPGVSAEVLTVASRVAEANAWRGRRIDPTGFYNLGARYYEPHSGRFLSPDPFGHGSDMSLYAFANGDPINRFDPDGRLAKKIINAFGASETERMMNEAEEVRSLVRQAQQMNADYGTAGHLIRAFPVINIGPNIHDFYLGETTSGRVYEPMEWAVKGVDVALIALPTSRVFAARFATPGRVSAQLITTTNSPGGITWTQAAENGLVNPKSLVSRQGPSEMTSNKVKRLTKDMQQYGFDPAHPIEVANVNGQQIIIDGHHRAAAAARAGVTEVPVTVTPVTPERAAQLAREAADAAAERSFRQ